MHITFGKHKGQEMQITVLGQRSLKDYFALGLPLPVSGPPTQHAPLDGYLARRRLAPYFPLCNMMGDFTKRRKQNI